MREPGMIVKVKTEREVCLERYWMLRGIAVDRVTCRKSCVKEERYNHKPMDVEIADFLERGKKDSVIFASVEELYEINDPLPFV